METGLGQYAPQIPAGLIGGLSTSLGTTWLLRKPRGRAMLLNMSGWGVALFALVSVGLGAGAVYRMVTWVLDSTSGQPEPASTGAMLMFGLAIGGAGGTVLKFEGDLSAEEGERLTVALRADLKEVGFKRVEGGGAKSWWVRV